MASLNRVQLIGRLGRDPEARYTPKGTKIVTFTVAVDHHWRNAEGESQHETDWFNIEAWGKLGEICQQYLKKGRQVYLEGRLHTSRYEQDSETKYFIKVILSSMQMLDRKPEEEPVEVIEEELV
jgi:single-strand DNA-binding protein